MAKPTNLLLVILYIWSYSTLALADEYFGIEYGSAELEVSGYQESWANWFDYQFNPQKQPTTRIFKGFKYNSDIDFEFGLFQTSEFKYHADGIWRGLWDIDESFKIKGLDAALNYWATPNLYLKLGGYISQITHKQHIYTARYTGDQITISSLPRNKTHTDLLAGIGYRLKLDDNSSLRASYTLYNNINNYSGFDRNLNNPLEESNNLNSFSIGLVFKF